MTSIQINVAGAIDADFVIREIEKSVSETVNKAVHDALYDAIKAEARKAYLNSDARGYALPRVVDVVLKRLIQESLEGKDAA